MPSGKTRTVSMNFLPGTAMVHSPWPFAGHRGLEGQLHVRGLEDDLLGPHVHQDVLEDGQRDPAVQGVLQDPQGAIQTILGNL